MFLRLFELFLDGVSMEYRVTVPLQKIILMAGPFNNILQKTEQSKGTLYFATQSYLGYSQFTLIHCSVRCHDSML
jgi:hypothetical protein